MLVDSELRAAFRPFARRAMWVAFVQALSIGLLLSLLSTEVAILSGAPSRAAAVILVAIAMIASAAYAFVRRPDMLTLARRIDERARLNDLLVTAVDCGGNAMYPVVRQMTLAALARESAARSFPIEVPRHWRRWLVVAGVVQLAAVPLAFRTPAGRAPQSGFTALTLPTARDEANASAPRNDQQRREGSSAERTDRPAGGSQSSREPLRVSPAGTDHPGAGASAAADARGERLRLAAAGAAAEIASGRVPLARRAIVEKYFATIQSLKGRPR